MCVMCWQDNGLNALAGVVSLCPTVTGEVFSVKEGNSAMTRVGAGVDAEAWCVELEGA